MGHLQVDLGLVQYDSNSLLSPVPLAAQIGLGAGAAVIILSVLVVILMYRYPNVYGDPADRDSIH